MMAAKAMREVFGNSDACSQFNTGNAATATDRSDKTTIGRTPNQPPGWAGGGGWQMK